MNKILLTILLSSCYMHLFSQTLMFRHNPEHNYPGVKSSAGVYDQLKWKINCFAPVRSTPLIVNDKLITGTTRGELLNISSATGRTNWKINLGKAINSSAAYMNGSLYVADNTPSLYSINLADGKIKWKCPLGKDKSYEWKYDYFSSSPVLYKNNVYIGSADGNVYCIDQAKGTVKWRFSTKGIVRATPSIYNDVLYIGDTEGYFFAINAITGKLTWTFNTEGVNFDNVKEGFDRKAILSTAVIHDKKIFFGSRDGFHYCLDAVNGKETWKNNHDVSWVITTPYIVDTFVIVASSDARFIQAVSTRTGKEIWRSATDGPVWSSALVINNIVYAASFNGTFYAVDLYTGKKISSFHAQGKIHSSPTLAGDRIYFGSDDGYIYALSARPRSSFKEQVRYVFFQPGLNVYFKNGIDTRVKNYLQDAGYATIDSAKLTNLFQQPVSNSVIVFATNYMPRNVLTGDENSLLKKFLNQGNKIIVLGNNPMIYELDSATHQVSGLNFSWFRSIDIAVPYNDLRMMKGTYAAFPNAKGIELGLPSFWTANHSLPFDQVNICLGVDENGLCSSWIKNFKNNGQFIQLWLNQETDLELGFILKVTGTDIK